MRRDVGRGHRIAEYPVGLREKGLWSGIPSGWRKSERTSPFIAELLLEWTVGPEVCLRAGCIRSNCILQ
jgi:hypothetical protein